MSTYCKYCRAVIVMLQRSVILLVVFDTRNDSAIKWLQLLSVIVDSELVEKVGSFREYHPYVGPRKGEERR